MQKEMLDPRRNLWMLDFKEACINLPGGANEVIVHDQAGENAHFPHAFELFKQLIGLLGPRVPAEGDHDMAEFALKRVPPGELHRSGSIPVHLEEIVSRFGQGGHDCPVFPRVNLSISPAVSKFLYEFGTDLIRRAGKNDLTSRIEGQGVIPSPEDGSNLGLARDIL